MTWWQGGGRPGPITPKIDDVIYEQPLIKLQPGKKCKNFSQRKLKEGEIKVETKKEESGLAKWKQKKRKWNEMKVVGLQERKNKCKKFLQ